MTQVIPIGEGNLSTSSARVIAHCHGERKGIDDRLMDSSVDDARTGGSIEFREGLGGLLRYYHRAA